MRTGAIALWCTVNIVGYGRKEEVRLSAFEGLAYVRERRGREDASSIQIAGPELHAVEVETPASMKSRLVDF
jgi:hypothetical protein